MAYSLKARTVELANGSETTFVSRQRLGKHVPAATDVHVQIEILLETAFSTRSLQRGCKEDNWGYRVSSVRESSGKEVTGMEPPFRKDLSA